MGLPTYVPGDDEILALASSYRHGLLNHLQVVLGWMKLGQECRAEEYVALLKESLDGESRMARAAKPEVASLLLLKKGVAEILGLEVRFQVAGAVQDVAWDSPATARYAGAVVEAAIRLLHRSGTGSKMVISLGEEGPLWKLEVRLVGVSTGGACEAALGEASAEEGRPFDFAAVRAAMEAGGGGMACEERHGESGPETVIAFSWPKLVSEAPVRAQAGEEAPCSSIPHASL